MSISTNASICNTVTRPFKSGEIVNIGKVGDNVGGLVLKVCLGKGATQPIQHNFRAEALQILPSTG
jgi:hypothetical protein